MSRDVAVAAPLKADAFGGSPVFRVLRETLAIQKLRLSRGSVKQRRVRFAGPRPTYPTSYVAFSPPSMIRLCPSRNVADVVAKGDTKATVITNEGFRLAFGIKQVFIRKVAPFVF